MGLIRLFVLFAGSVVMNIKKVLLASLCFSILALLSGCGGGSESTTYDRSLKGTTVDTEQQPIADATVTLSTENGPVAETTTDSKGNFTLNYLVVGEDLGSYTLEIKTAGVLVQTVVPDEIINTQENIRIIVEVDKDKQTADITKVMSEDEINSGKSDPQSDFDLGSDPETSESSNPQDSAGTERPGTPEAPQDTPDTGNPPPVQDPTPTPTPATGPGNNPQESQSYNYWLFVRNNLETTPVYIQFEARNSEGEVVARNSIPIAQGREELFPFETNAASVSTTTWVSNFEGFERSEAIYQDTRTLIGQSQTRTRAISGNEQADILAYVFDDITEANGQRITAQPVVANSVTNDIIEGDVQVIDRKDSRAPTIEITNTTDRRMYFYYFLEGVHLGPIGPHEIAPGDKLAIEYISRIDANLFYGFSFDKPIVKPEDAVYIGSSRVGPETTNRVELRVKGENGAYKALSTDIYVQSKDGSGVTLDSKVAEFHAMPIDSAPVDQPVDNPEKEPANSDAPNDSKETEPDTAPIADPIEPGAR